jgi:hypothetical protein
VVENGVNFCNSPDFGQKNISPEAVYEKRTLFIAGSGGS